jgi:uncharacterized protein
MSREDIPVFIGMRSNVSAEIDLLWTLLGLDEQLVAARAALRRFPEQRRTIEERLAAMRARLEHARAGLAERQKKRRALEQEIAALTEVERKFQGQLFSVKKNEEYSALVTEIEGTRRRRSDLETEVLMGLESDDREQAERSTVERELAAAERESAERLGRLDAEERTERERADAIEAERRRHLEGLASALRSRYERIWTSREGRALVPILKGACGGCFRGQPPQVLQEARRRDRVLVCDGCGRLLLWPPEAA